MKQPTIVDIATRTGFSKSTVSRALNKSPLIGAKTREIIERAAKELDYEPNLVARSLTKQRTRTIGVILEDIANPFFTEVVKGIEWVLKNAGLTMMVTSSEYQEYHELVQARTFVQNKVDGILVTPVDSHDKSVKLLRSRGVPFVLMNGRSEDADVSWVDNDSYHGGYILTKYLLEGGHRRFIYLRSTRVESLKYRLAGFVKAIEEFGLKVEDQILLEDLLTREDGYRLIDEYLSQEPPTPRPTALIAQNDDGAIGAMERLLEEGIRIPEDLSVAGYDDVNVASLVRVPLTTVHQMKFTMGKIAAEALVSQIEARQNNEEESATQTLLTPRLVVRQSTMELVDE